MMPQLFRSSGETSTPAYASAGTASRVRHARERVVLDLADDVLFGRLDGPAVQADPEAEQRVGEAVALLTGHDEVDVLEPREVVLRGARACGAADARSR